VVDNDLIREIVTRTLQKMKFSVTAVEDGNAALRAIEERDFDLMYVPSSLLSLAILTDAVYVVSWTARCQDWMGTRRLARSDNSLLPARGKSRSLLSPPVPSREIASAVSQQVWMDTSQRYVPLSVLLDFPVLNFCS
jgi:hypothetical protein